MLEIKHDLKMEKIFICLSKVKYFEINEFSKNLIWIQKLCKIIRFN